MSRAALNELCAAYHYPLYCFIRRRGLAHHDAQDVLHDFLAKLLRLEAFLDLDREKGRLRTYLLKALSNFLITRHHQRTHLQQQCEESLDALPLDSLMHRYQSEALAIGETAEDAFDRQWCAQLLEHVLAQLQQAYAERGKSALFAVLCPVLVSGGSLKGHDSQQLAEAICMTPAALRVALLRMLREYRELLRQEVRQTVGHTEDVDAEIASLIQIYSAR